MKITLVSYINTKPFIEGLEKEFGAGELELELLPPAQCAVSLKQKKCQMALIPVGSLVDFEDLELMKDYCIGADGPVDSVFLFSRQPVGTLDTILLDLHSRTSNGLTRILLENYFQLSPKFAYPEGKHFDQIQGKTGGVVIGDKALKIREEFEFAYDLAAEWKNWTGLPFAFAVWACYPGTLSEEQVDKIRNAQKKGMENLPETAKKWASTFGMSEEKAVDYLTRSISYPFDVQKQKALLRYLDLLKNLPKIDLPHIQK